MFEINEKLTYKSLSRGQKTLLSNIIGICSNCPITIFDEPTVGLDAVNRYYFYEYGFLVTGWQTIFGNKYFFMPEGYMMPGWISYGSTRYYLDKKGVMQTGWQTLDGKRYFFMPEG